MEDAEREKGFLASDMHDDICVEYNLGGTLCATPLRCLGTAMMVVRPIIVIHSLFVHPKCITTYMTSKKFLARQ